MSETDLTQITGESVKRLGRFTTDILQNLGAQAVKVGVYAPQNIPFGLARMYSSIVEGAPEQVAVFRELSRATQWVKHESSLKQKS